MRSPAMPTKPQAVEFRRKRLWAIKMLFVWRWRLGYWDWEAFRMAWALRDVVTVQPIEGGDGA